jgi:hypothetical protein
MGHELLMKPPAKNHEMWLPTMTRMSRKKAVRIIAAAAMVLVVGLVAFASAHQFPRAADTGSSATATGWVDHPAAIPAYSTPRNPGIAACDSADLGVRLARHGVLSLGTYAYIYSATNTTSHDCYVSGLPSVELAGKTAAGGANLLDVEAGVLTPGASATFAVTQSARASCTPAVTSDGVTRTSAVTPRVEIGARSAATSAGTVLIGNCTDSTVTPIGLAPTQPAPDAFTPLDVELQVPTSVRAGTTLQFTVTITNPTRAAIRLSPCPSYEIGISSAPTVAYELNCSAPVIEPGQTRSYEMRYSVPAKTPAGLAKIGWFLLNSTRTGAGGVITIIR